MEQHGGRLNAGKHGVDCGWACDKTFHIMITIMVLLFAPLSFTYFLSLDPANMSNWSSKVMAILVSKEFAYGNGSGTNDQAFVLLRNFHSMLSHTIAGTIAIVVGLCQFNSTLQFKCPVVHRYLGRIYFLCAMIITLSSCTFLMDTMPTKEVFSGETFALILSMLSVGVFTSMACAMFAISKRDIGSHREFMALNYSLMLSAPVLRVCWLVLGQFWSESKYVINLYSAIFSGPFLITGPMFYLRTRQRRPTSPFLISPKFRRAVLGSSLLSLIFLIQKLPDFKKGSYPMAFHLAVGPQWIFQAGSFTFFAQTASNRGDVAAYTAWTTYRNGLISGPFWGVLVYYISRDIFYCSVEALGPNTITGAWIAGLFSSYMIYVFFTSKFINSNSRI